MPQNQLPATASCVYLLGMDMVQGWLVKESAHLLRSGWEALAYRKVCWCKAGGDSREGLLSGSPNHLELPVTSCAPSLLPSQEIKDVELSRLSWFRAQRCSSCVLLKNWGGAQIFLLLFALLNLRIKLAHEYTWMPWAQDNECNKIYLFAELKTPQLHWGQGKRVNLIPLTQGQFHPII